LLNIHIWNKRTWWW